MPNKLAPWFNGNSRFQKIIIGKFSQAMEYKFISCNIRNLVLQYAITADQIFEGRSIGQSSTKRGPKTGQSVPPKYQDPATGKTWSGRGIAPSWIKDKNKEDFLIAKP
jgi:DNA-binding protein H-NS